MKNFKLYPAVLILLIFFSLNCKKGPDIPTAEVPPWEKIVTVKETVKDSPETELQGFFLVLTDAPEFYNKPGGTLLSKANLKKIKYDACATMDYFPQKNETGNVISTMIYDYTKYYKLDFFPSEPCRFSVWVPGSAGAILTPVQFTEYTKTKSTLEPAVMEAVTASKVEALNFTTGIKTLMTKSADSSFYLITIMNGFVPARLKNKIDPGYNNSGNHQFVVMEKGGIYTLASPDMKVRYIEPLVKNDESAGSIKYADTDGDGIAEIITLRPTVGSTPASELYGFVDGVYRIIEECQEGSSCTLAFEGKLVVKNSSEYSNEQNAAGQDPWVKKTEKYSYKAGKLTLLPEAK